MSSKEECRIRSIKHMFERSVERYGGRAAFWVKTKKEEVCSAITYEDVYRDVCGLGTSLITLGMKGKRIAIVGENSYEWAASYLAAICGAGVAVPLDKALCINELKYFLNITRCSCAIFSGELEDIFWQIRNDGVTELEILINMDKETSDGGILSLHELIDEGRQMMTSGNHDFINSRIIRDELCAILLTAGTADVSKAVNLSHKNIAAEIMLVSLVLNITESDVFFSSFPLHCACECICGILLPLYKGASITYCESINPHLNISAVQGYSLTESTSIVALNPENGSAGRLLPEMKAKIANPDAKTGVGEICLAGENIMTGYCENPEATVKVLIGGWLYTGDLGKIDENGHIYVAGKKENVIIAGNGEPVYPEELENCLCGIPYVKECMVWYKDSNDSDASILTATILVNKEQVFERLGDGYSEQELEKLLWREIEKINENLPYHKRMQKMVLRKEEFQKNSSQKIVRWYPANKE